ncbi:MAG TPA: hypothetical protein VL793_09145 [Patescibacteria group bacterium]|nr:hypothetical protein [Patescibacteria group bacterium]
MKRTGGIRQQGKATIELIEEAIHLLRMAPLLPFAVYYIGSLPFVLAALYFWADMSRSPFAGQHLVGNALALAALYLWMKTCQSVFSRDMRCLASNETPSFAAVRFGRIFVTQAALQPTGLFLLPIMLVLTVPFGWVFAFYQNLTALDDGQILNVRTVVRSAARQAQLWPKQNHVMLAIISGFGAFVCLNLVSACFMLPNLVKTLFGIESVFTRSGVSMLNTTFFVATFGLTYLCVDPLLKTIYALRCFYGESQRSGADLKAELRRAATAPAVPALLSVALLTCFLQATKALAAEQQQAESALANERPAIQLKDHPAQSSLPPAQLDRAIQQVIQQPKYAWRQPRQKLIEPRASERGFFGRLMDRIKPFLIDTLKAIGRWLDAFFRRWFGSRGFGQKNYDTSRWVAFLHVMVYVLIAVAAAGLIWLVYRIWQNRHRTVETVASVPMKPVPDLSDENLGADQLPEDGWMKLGHELLAQGKLRLALRAFYLASLAQLASKNLIQLARFKSNNDYERELRRRAHAIPGLVTAFGDNSQVFDRTWYGMYEVNPEVVNGFASNVERMRSADTAAPASMVTA